MKLYVVFIDGEPRLDIASTDKGTIGQRAVKVMHPHTWLSLNREGRVQIKQIKLEVMV